MILTSESYITRSTGAGVLVVWIDYLKNIIFLDYNTPYYKDIAIKMGAGVRGFEAYEAADKIGPAVVGRECPTVGLAGGYTQDKFLDPNPLSSPIPTSTSPEYCRRRSFRTCLEV